MVAWNEGSDRPSKRFDRCGARRHGFAALTRLKKLFDMFGLLVSGAEAHGRCHVQPSTGFPFIPSQSCWPVRSGNGCLRFRRDLGFSPKGGDLGELFC